MGRVRSGCTDRNLLQCNELFHFSKNNNHDTRFDVLYHAPGIFSAMHSSIVDEGTMVVYTWVRSRNVLERRYISDKDKKIK